jgi:hypothetical protein
VLIQRSLQVDIRYFYSLNLNSEETGGHIIWPKGKHSLGHLRRKEFKLPEIVWKKILERISILEREEGKGLAKFHEILLE